MMGELKPCPFCGGEAFHRGYDVVWCKKCSAEAYVDDWNRRPDAPSAGGIRHPAPASNCGGVRPGNSLAARGGFVGGNARCMSDDSPLFTATRWLDAPAPSGHPSTRGRANDPVFNNITD